MTNYNKVIKGVNGKEEHAWKVLFDSFYVPLCLYATRILRDKQVAGDVVQDTFIRLWESDICFMSGNGMVTYLYRAVANNSLKYLRDRNTEDEHLKEWLEWEDMSEDNFANVVREELYRRLREILNKLPEDRRKIVLMSMEGLKGDEIAAQLGVTIHTVKQQKYRAYKFIRAYLGDHLSWIFIFFFA
ncbi:MAG TPA: RNA polymerase sigma-70 factor [Butyricimonas virosa]|uniref:RNA polymerase sigma-70 factor n=1 Tax=Butyricimonas virosa TaxID=544645 RepID=A0A921KZ59_9BACT|nr:RNA polymerase sigma-70 factor [Butyricimonas virosa]